MAKQIAYICLLLIASLVPSEQVLTTCYTSAVSGTTTTVSTGACTAATNIGGTTTYNGCQAGVTSSGTFIHSCIPSTSSCSCGSVTYGGVSYYIKSAQCTFTTDLVYTAYCSKASQSLMQSFGVLLATTLVSFGLYKF